MPKRNNSDIHKLFFFLPKSRRKQVAGIILLTFIAAIAEMASIGAIVPFIAIISDPEATMRNEYVLVLASYFNVSTQREMIFIIASIFSVAAIFAGLIRYALLWYQTKFSFGVGGDVSREIYKLTLQQDYKVHLARNSSDIISAITVKVRDVVNLIIGPWINLVSSLFLLIAIASFLFFVDPYVALMAFSMFGSLYAVIAVVVKNRLVRHGEIKTKNQSLIVKSLQEGLGGIRDVIIDRMQPAFLKKFVRHDMPARSSDVSIIVISQAPRYLVEAFGLVMIACMSYILLFVFQRPGNILATLGALGLGAQRMLPLLQQTYWSYSQIHGGKTSLKDVVKLLEQDDDSLSELGDPLMFEKSISLKNMTYKYPGASQSVLKNISIEVDKGGKVGIIGDTGSGKSTLVDILMGLLSPESGSIKIDHVELSTPLDLARWRDKVSHVPQSIFLADATIKENIAFGVDIADIDESRIKEVADLSCLGEFINNLPLGFETIIGENGALISGGQRQRIGIARALYRKAEVIVFDEATSALDGRTEAKIIQGIESLDKNVTIFMIAHRISTLKNCNSILRVANKGIEKVDYKSLVGSM